MVDPIFSDEFLMSPEVKEIAAFEIPKFIDAEDNELGSSSLKISKAFGRCASFEIYTDKTNVDAEKNLIESFRKNIQLLVQKTWVEKDDDLESYEIFNIDSYNENREEYTKEMEEWYNKKGILEEFNKAMEDKDILKVYLNDNLYVLPEGTEETEYDDLIQLSNGRLYDLWSEYLFDEEDSSILLEMLDSDWFNYVYDGVEDFFYQKEAYLEESDEEDEYDADEDSDED